MKNIKIIILVFLTIPIYVFSQENNSFSLILCKLTTKNVFSQEYKPNYKYFKSYNNKIGFELKYNFVYLKRFEFSPNIEIYFFSNELTKLNGNKYDFSLYNGFRIYQHKKLNINLNAGIGYSLFEISNSKQSNYHFTHLYKGFLLNLDVETRYKLKNNLFISICLTNSYYKILKNDKYIKDETISYKNDFMILKLGLNYIFLDQLKNNQEDKK